MKFILPFLLFATVLFSQHLVINEVMTSNKATIKDSEGDWSDWIELVNSGDEPMNLMEFGLSDDPDNLQKWTFPNRIISPGEYLLVFASDKDIKNPVKWTTIIDKGANWKYKIWNNQPPYTWNTIQYNDDNWLSGNTGIGYADGDDETLIPVGTISLYARKKFTLNTPEDIKKVVLSLDYDDGFVAYLNGVEIARSNVQGYPPAFNEAAIVPHEAVLYTLQPPENFAITDFKNILVPGENMLAVEIHNAGTSSSDFSFIAFLSLASQQLPEGSPDVSTYLEFSAADFHTNFKLSSDGETLILSDQNATIIEQVDLPALPTDVSLGRKPDGHGSWQYFYEATPGGPNSTQGYSTLPPTVSFDLDPGFYAHTINLALVASDDSSSIYYTTDGSVPDVESSLYQNPIRLSSTQVIRARAISKGIGGNIISGTYWINKNHQLPVVSLITDPPNLWSPDSGIYTLGYNYDPNIPHYGANFWQDWERPVHIELYEPDGKSGFSINAGVKIFGGWSRAIEMKSLAIFARSIYGDAKISCQVFPDLHIDQFENLVLRNSANDFQYTLFRDGFMQSLVKDTHIDCQAYRPSVVYINGEYWGIHNIREKLNEHYIASHHGVDPDQIDLLESNGQANQGDANDWFQLVDYINTHDLGIESNFDYLRDQVDLENFMEYYIAQIYFDNTDWPGNNIKYWKEKNESGKWRWILYDTDFGFGLYGGYGFSERDRYRHNTLAFAMAANGPDWPNPPWSTLLLRKLNQNANFRNDFINCFCDNLNTRFKAAWVLQKIQEAQGRIAPEIPNHISRWGAFDLNSWQSNIETMKIFAQNRPGYCMVHLNSQFNLQGTALLTLKIEPPNSGVIELNTVSIEDSAWSGYYFKGVPIHLKAIAKSGFSFEKWSGHLESGINSLVDISMTKTMEITCHFSEGASGSDIVINEINYKSSADFDTGDWVELLNNTGDDLDMSGWVFRDSDDEHAFVFPSDFVLGAGEYIVLADKEDDFLKYYPQASYYAGELGFGFSSEGEYLRLFNAQGYLVDSVNYQSTPPWPVEAAGSGATLALKNPNRENTQAENWKASEDHGTPGTQNDAFASNTKPEITVSHFLLQQNYPNPFNGTTVLGFFLPLPGKVNLSVYDLAGSHIETLTKENFQSGYHEIHYTPQPSVASGIYFCRMDYHGKSQLTKMVFLK
ncbi:MAG: CotH kinase family protein [Candidatus Marinimicrobia bacterium]|nr:CotH kinase family protein [Candidatus Neomarinimicrobiota bacterium]